MNGLGGTCASEFRGVSDLLASRLERGEDLGASVCVIKDGSMVVDLWGGVADAESGRPWTRDTLVNTYSLTKTMVALVALSLIEHGDLDPERRVAYYWPEFGAAGKQDVLVRHILGHTSGVCGWSENVTLEDIYDTESSAALLAAQPPWWRPGDGSGYQAVNHGHLVDGIVRRITGQSLGEILAEEFTGPASADYWLGTPSSVDARLATLVPPPPSGLDYATLPADSVFVKTMTNPVIPPAVTTTRPFLAAEIGGANGQGNARSVARLQSIVSHDGTLEGRQYISPATIRRVFAEQSGGVDRVLGTRVRFGLGYALPTPESMPELPVSATCWWTGFGGSIVVNDLDRRMTVAYVMNKMAPGLVGAENARSYLDAVYRALRA